jgi:hypothetical protein
VVLPVPGASRPRNQGLNAALLRVSFVFLEAETPYPFDPVWPIFVGRAGVGFWDGLHSY